MIDFCKIVLLKTCEKLDNSLINLQTVNLGPKKVSFKIFKGIFKVYVHQKVLWYYFQIKENTSQIRTFD